MNLNPIKANMTELSLGDDTLVLFSYKTPVAARYWTSNKSRLRFIKTDKFWSKTTSNHINEWLETFGDIIVENESQEFLNGLVK